MGASDWLDGEEFVGFDKGAGEGRVYFRAVGAVVEVSCLVVIAGGIRAVSSISFLLIMLIIQLRILTLEA